MKKFTSKKWLENHGYEFLHTTGDWCLWVRNRSHIWWNWKTFEYIEMRTPKIVKAHQKCPNNTA